MSFTTFLEWVKALVLVLGGLKLRGEQMEIVLKGFAFVRVAVVSCLSFIV